METGRNFGQLKIRKQNDRLRRVGEQMESPMGWNEKVKSWKVGERRGQRGVCSTGASARTQEFQEDPEMTVESRLKTL